MWMAFFIVFAGLALIGVEFFLPGGIFATIGTLLLFGAGIYTSFLDIPLSMKALFYVASAAAAAGVCFLSLTILKRREKDQFILVSDQEEMTASTFDSTLVGKQGEVASDLKPSGHILVGGKRVQAVSEGEYIKKGTAITIIKGQGAYLIVKEES